jgi:hypothetical protein
LSELRQRGPADCRQPGAQLDQVEALEPALYLADTTLADPKSIRQLDLCQARLPAASPQQVSKYVLGWLEAL